MNGILKGASGRLTGVKLLNRTIRNQVAVIRKVEKEGDDLSPATTHIFWVSPYKIEGK